MTKSTMSPRCRCTCCRISDRRERVQGGQRSALPASEISSKLKNLKCGIVSASESEVVQSTLKKANILHFFDSITSRLTIGPNKPHPYPYQVAMKKLKVSPSETLIFEDSPTGLQAANNSGAKRVIKVETFKSQN